MSGSSTKAIMMAFIANSGIAIAKTAGALHTGSGSMMAEAIHSFADCINQVLLFVGIKRSEKKPDAKHPMGYARESYFWSMIVAMMLFFLGGAFAIYEGAHRLMHPGSLESPEIGLAILAFGVLLEGWSLRGAIQATKEKRGDKSLWQWFKDTHQSELMVIVGEDFAAIAGLSLAFVMLGLSMWTGDLMYDALGSILIGVLLVVVSFFVAREIHSLTVGEAAVEVRDNVKTHLDSLTFIDEVFDIIATHHGSEVMVAIKAKPESNMNSDVLIELINQAENDIKKNNPTVKWLFFEVDNIA